MNKQTYKFYHRLARIQRREGRFFAHKRHCTRPFVFNCNIEDLIIDAGTADLLKRISLLRAN